MEKEELISQQVQSAVAPLAKMVMNLKDELRRVENIKKSKKTSGY